MTCRYTGDGSVGVPPIHFLLCRYVMSGEKGCQTKWNNKTRLIPPGDSLQRADVEMIVMSMAEQNKMDLRQVLEEHFKSAQLHG